MRLEAPLTMLTVVVYIVGSLTRAWRIDSAQIHMVDTIILTGTYLYAQTQAQDPRVLLLFPPGLWTSSLAPPTSPSSRGSSAPLAPPTSSSFRHHLPWQGRHCRHRLRHLRALPGHPFWHPPPWHQQASAHRHPHGHHWHHGRQQLQQHRWESSSSMASLTHLITYLTFHMVLAIFDLTFFILHSGIVWSWHTGWQSTSTKSGRSSSSTVASRDAAA